MKNIISTRHVDVIQVLLAIFTESLLCDSFGGPGGITVDCKSFFSKRQKENLFKGVLSTVDYESCSYYMHKDGKIWVCLHMHVIGVFWQESSTNHLSLQPFVFRSLDI